MAEYLAKTERKKRKTYCSIAVIVLFKEFLLEKYILFMSTNRDEKKPKFKRVYDLRGGTSF